MDDGGAKGTLRPFAWDDWSGGRLLPCLLWQGMALRQILTFPDPRLRRLCTPVGQIDSDVLHLVQDMLETMYHAQGRGLAAPQIGEMRRIFVMDVGWKDGAPETYVCINPVILETSPDVADYTEACLSMPGVTAKVARPCVITLQWTDLGGALQIEQLSGMAAICAQHELDHLNGRLCIDLLDEDARMAASPALTQVGVS